MKLSEHFVQTKTVRQNSDIAHVIAIKRLVNSVVFLFLFLHELRGIVAVPGFYPLIIYLSVSRKARTNLVCPSRGNKEELDPAIQVER